MKRAISFLMFTVFFAAVLAPFALADVIEEPPIFPVADDTGGTLTIAILIVAAVIVITAVLIFLLRRRKK